MIGINRRYPGDTGSQLPCVGRLAARLPRPAVVVALLMIGTSPALAQFPLATLEELRRELSPGDFISLVQIQESRSAGESCASQTPLSTSALRFGRPRANSAWTSRSLWGYSVAGAASRLCAQRRAYWGRHRSRGGARDVHLRGGRGLQRDQRVGPDVSGDGGRLHGHRRARWLGDRLRTLEAARQIQRAVRRHDENPSGSAPRTRQGSGVRRGFLTPRSASAKSDNVSGYTAV